MHYSGKSMGNIVHIKYIIYITRPRSTKGRVWSNIDYGHLMAIIGWKGAVQQKHE